MTHIHLPNLDELKELIKSNPKLLNYYSKVDGWVGPTDSMEYLLKTLTKL